MRCSCWRSRTFWRSFTPCSRGGARRLPTSCLDTPQGYSCRHGSWLRRPQGRRAEAPTANRGPSPRPPADGRRGSVLHRRADPGVGDDEGAAGRGARAARGPSRALRHPCHQERRPGGDRKGARGDRSHRATGQVLMDTIGRSLVDGLGMFWETLWALVLGFALSGVVQAFVSRAEMQRSLGNRRPATIAKAGFFGVISSSCSYAASALAKTLFQRGADFTTAQAFMFASTNLVLEIGIVLWLLIGWEFAAAEFVGGAMMIVLLAVVVPRVVSDPEQLAARAALSDGEHDAGAHDAHAGHGVPDSADASGPWRTRIRSVAGWSDAAAYTISDLTMLRREIVIGFVIAGFADAAVPVEFWKSLFSTGHGVWSDLENVVLGPFLAIISFVCSIGNVPLAAALW